MYKYLIFDLDGTLVDTLPDLVFSVNQALLELGLNKCNVNDLKDKVGLGLGEMFKKALLLNEAIDHLENFAGVKNNFYPFMIEEYHKNICEDSKTFAGVISFLELMEKKNIPISICSNKPHYLCEKLCHELGITKYFQKIIGGDSFGKAKPSPLMLDHAINYLGIEKEKVLFIGDSDIDLLTSFHANIDFACAKYGYGPYEVLNIKDETVMRNILDENILYDRSLVKKAINIFWIDEFNALTNLI